LVKFISNYIDKKNIMISVDKVITLSAFLF